MLLCPVGHAASHTLRGDHQWLGKTRGAGSVALHPDDDGAGDIMARMFERGEGGPPAFVADHGGRGDHTELLDLTDYTQKKRHKERARAVPKGFHLPGEKKEDGVGDNASLSA
eukprot:COSAG02_NODE_785_length_17228_cov_24.082141_12_plen_113_part_00